MKSRAAVLHQMGAETPYALDDVNEAFDRLARGDAIRQVITF